MKLEQKELILDYLHQRLAPEDENKLHTLLDQSAEARSFLRIQSAIDAHLYEMALNSPCLIISDSKRKKSPTLLIFAALAASIALFAAFFHQSKPQPQDAITIYDTPADGPISIMPESSPGIALLKSTNRIVWQTDSIHPAAGSTLTAGWLSLTSGIIQIEFFSGARLLVEGPASIRLDTANSAYLSYGKASAHVPEPAHGFIMESPYLHIKDLGTAFGLSITKNKDPEVHVFAGSIELSTKSGNDTARLLLASNALKLNGGNLLKIPIRRSDFPNTEEISRRNFNDNIIRHELWSSAVQQLAHDPAALIVYNFEGEAEWNNIVKNCVPNTDPETNATIIGTGWTSGRWGGKQGLEFRTLGDRLNFSVPGKHQQLTTMAWIRVDSLANDYNALLMPSHYSVGSIHWTIERGGEMRLCQLLNPSMPLHSDSWNGPISGKGFSALDMGRWIFVATTYDSVTSTVTHFRDGHIVGRGNFPSAKLVTLGEMEFGNWGADGHSPDNEWIKYQPPLQKQRNFVGRLDHLAIYSRVFSAEEITKLYQIGSP